MPDLNLLLFQWLNAGAAPSATILALARRCAEGLILSVPLALVVGWLRAGVPSARLVLLEAALGGALALALAQFIGWAWPQPRPFMMGLGHTWLAHAADASFPSDHLTLMSAVAWRLLAAPRWRRVGLALALLAVPVAWARVFLGVHMPRDMAGAVAVGLAGAALATVARPALALALPVLLRLYRAAFAPCIRRGWCRP